MLYARVLSKNYAGTDLRKWGIAEEDNAFLMGYRTALEDSLDRERGERGLRLPSGEEIELSKAPNMVIEGYGRYIGEPTYVQESMRFNETMKRMIIEANNKNRERIEKEGTSEWEV